jgi:hypothetical protein
MGSEEKPPNDTGYILSEIMCSHLVSPVDFGQRRGGASRKQNWGREEKRQQPMKEGLHSRQAH